ncbi:MAG: hypothetical protein WCV68_03335 [Candidatus Paceibacterota bacterium]|jgi:hypothetical protein
MSLQVIIASLKGTIINPLIGILIGLGFLLFFWGIARYLFSLSNDVKKLEDAKQFMLWGVIIITVMISVWGLVQLLQGIFLGGANFSSPPAIPKMGGSTAAAPATPPAVPFSVDPATCDPDASPGEFNACPPI